MKMKMPYRTGMALVAAALVLGAVPALAALDPYGVPTLDFVSCGENEITIKICGNPDAPAGVTVQWKTQADYDASGWADDGTLCKLSLSGQPSLQHPGQSRWDLFGGQCEEITLGDINFDETGVSGQNCGLDPLECGTDYVFRTFAHAGRGMGRSAFSDNYTFSTCDCPVEECTFTQGYWKTHGPVGCQTGNNTNVWPLTNLTLGFNPGVNYNQGQLCQILNTPAGGNGLTSLAHQLIAARFNEAIGAGCPAATTAMNSADMVIGNLVVKPVGSGFLAPGTTSALTTTLDNFNNGGTLVGCPPHCNSVMLRRWLQGRAANKNPDESRSWGAVKGLYR